MYGRLALILALAGVVYPWGVFAQSSQLQSDGDAPAHVAYVEGAATLERDGRLENAPLNMPLLSGDRLKTIDGRVEILFADASALHLDSRTTMDIQSDELVRLLDGRLRLNIASAQGRLVRVAYRVDSPAGSVRITQPGEYRIALLRSQDETQLELAVLRGAGEIFTDEGTTAVRAGERAYASAGLAPSYAYAYNSANWDDFDRWSESRRDTRLGVSTQYLPSEVRGYSSTFDEYGDWRYEQSYGYVWYPRVAVSWRPYYYGRWAQYPRYGWTWIGTDRFAWPTHHYGRWGFRANAWFWIPANHWAPAHVSWAYAPGYVSWCPLGFDNRPVIAANIFSVGPGYYSSARAWTAVGYSHFGRDYVHRRAVDWERFDRNRPSFQVGRSAPVSRDVAVPRNSTGAQGVASNAEGRNSTTPIRWAGSRSRPSEDGSQAVGATRSTAAAVSRGFAVDAGDRTVVGSAPRYINRGDEIIRSRAGRPSPVRDSPGVQAIPATASPDTAGGTRTGYAIQRTAPGGPARRLDSPGATAAPVSSGIERPGGARDTAVSRYAPRSSYQSEDRAQPRGGAGAVPDNPAYRPQPYQPPLGTSDRSAQPRSAAPSREPSVEAGPGPAPGYASPRGGFETRPAPAPSPNAGSGRQTPAPRAVPSPERSAPSGGTAVPRDGGGGRGGAPGGGASGARSRGRGGV